MNLRAILFTITLAYSGASFAIFCPTNFNQIDYGNSQAEVAAQCGKPTKVNKYNSTANEPQEWTYFVKMNPTDQGTMKVTFAFVDDKLTNMTSNGIGVGATTICGGVNLQLGSSTEVVEQACGKPALITKTNIPGTDALGTPPTEIVEWVYEGTPHGDINFRK